MLHRSVCIVWLLAATAQAQSSGTSLSADQIAAQMERMNALRAQSQLRIACERTYVIDYQGFLGTRHAEMRVHAEQQGDEKNLTIVDESGSTILRTKVLHKLLDGEREASEAAAHAENRLARSNYDFSLEDTQSSPPHSLYALDITPKAKSKFAWKGRIWIDPVDYAVVRAEGQPAKLPSWWTTYSEFTYTNQKIDGLWVPEQNVSDTHVRLGGHAHLRIDYGSCRTSPALNAPDPQRISSGETQSTSKPR
jgi:outer membrane lipoprotein-sorting protein